MNKLEVAKLKEIMNEHPGKLQEKNNQIAKIRDNATKFKEESQRNLELKEKYRKRYEEIKGKYKQLKEKFKQENTTDYPEYDDSNAMNSQKQIRLPLSLTPSSV